MNIEFVKMVGSGNDFIMIDNRTKNIPDNQIPEIAKILCNRIQGIGADGIILIEKSDIAHFKMRIINSDGSEAEMCGNGARCAADFAYRKGIADKNMKFDTLSGIVEGEVKDNDIVKIKMTEPHSIRENIKLELEELNDKEVFSVDTGVPHVVIFFDNIEDVNIKSLGSKIRYHDEFKPKGTNVNFVKILDKNNIAVRTYERGVEGETLSCGSGSVASAIFAGLKKGLNSPIHVHTQSGEILNIYFSNNNSKITDVYLEGKVSKVFEGKIEVL
ncbi:diaminopimelate epimerase [bacterium]